MMRLFSNGAWVALGCLVLCAASAPAGENNEILRARFSRKLIDGLFRMPVENERSISQDIKNTVIRGTALTKGEIFLELVPAANNAVLNITVEAETNSHSVAKNIPRKDITVHINSTTHSKIHAEKSLIVYQDHLELRPALARATTELTYNQVNIDASGAFKNLKEKIAHEQALNQLRREKPVREADVSKTAADEMRKILDDRITPTMFRSLNVTFKKEFYGPLFASGRVPANFHFSTLPQSLSVVLDAAEDLPQAAQTARPDFSRESVVAFRLHDSLLTQMLVTRLKGQSMNEEDLEEFLIKHGMPSVLAHYRASDPQLSMKFGNEAPIQVRFTQGFFEIALQTEHAELAGKSYGALHATARYRIQGLPNGNLVFSRQTLETEHDAEVEKRFSRLLPERIPMEKIELPLAVDLKGHLELMNSQADNGWLLVEWRLAK